MKAADDPLQTVARRLVGEEKAASFLDCKKQTLSVWRMQGTGPPFYKIGRLVKYDLSDLAAYLESRKCRNTAEANALEV
jgi:hypothetical protein